MRNEKGIALPIIILIAAVVLGGVAFGIYKYTNSSSSEVMLRPSPSIEASSSATPTSSASASVKPTTKPAVKPTPTPTPKATASPTPAPTQEASNNNSGGGDCGGKELSLTIQPDGPIQGDTLVRITGRSDSEGCGFGTSQEEILRQTGSITISGLTPATYNLFVTYHGKQYNEEFTIKKGENASKTVNVTN